ncbi:MAG: SDR family oxidoreductase, partial [Alphaproteobacteria bacterium]|nr:SDR family oxidoreductase [Alphaproteobacteria bacterium]
KYGVRVNAIAPGFILTDLTKKMWANDKMLAWHKATTPLQRMGEVEDLVGTAIFLASASAAYITGQIIRIDGGATAGTHWPIAADFEVTHND